MGGRGADLLNTVQFGELLFARLGSQASVILPSSKEDNLETDGLPSLF